LNIHVQFSSLHGGQLKGADMKKVLLFLANGFEEVEAVTPIDFLRRAGVQVTTVGIGGNRIEGAHGIVIEADTSLADFYTSTGPEDGDDYDGIICPGGMPGAANIAAEDRILSMIEDYNRQGKIVAAICASPGVILAGTTVLDGRKATCYPGFEKHFGASTEFSTERVVVDHNIITSRGPGTSAEFSIELIRAFTDDKTAEAVKNGTIQNI